MRLPSRDSTSLALAVVAILLVASYGPSTGQWLVIGAVAGIVVGAGWPRLFGEQWADARWPLGCAVAIALSCVPLSNSDSSGAYTLSLILPAAGALPLAHLIAARQADRNVSRWLFLTGAGAAVGVALFALATVNSGYPVYSPFPYLLMGVVALLPAFGILLDPAGGIAEGRNASGITDRLALVALGATPGAAMTVLPPHDPDPLIFVGWLVVLVIWRRFTIAPLLGFSQRTQKQRDLTAIEAERARIAADLHDDALQELTALVRRLDVAGDTEGAELARGVAERLRAICSDLRLPLLDDLGAGAALEWLVARIEPMAGGPVRLERIDAQRPPSGVELAVFRVAQEALADAVKHGRPPITVRYRVDESGHVSLSIDDLGTGIEPGAAETALAAGRLGMANMQQRAEQIGALLDVRRWPTGGTHVTLEWRPG
jgi:signal transduction histidine kinase